ncbi:FHA domain-containing protein [Serinicoccus sediminis]|uniref:FHA domain-containing protein n=1 Tax=Serinicoccus sediminis TaxID=2306021 RepID=UPI001EDD5352|nr:FHA domain-containing protein [Serinicoccus sediminis]
MAEQLRVDADLTLTVSTPASGPGTEEEQLTARIVGTGAEIEVTLDRLVGLPVGMGRRRAADLASDVGTVLADAGLTVVVSGPDGPVLAVGAVRSRFLDRAVTGSRHVAVRDRRAALRLLRRSDGEGPSLADLTPPGTPWPLVPVAPPRRRRRVTTTHDPLGRGEPRLVYYLPPGPERGSPRQTAFLRRGTTTIGSDPGNDVVVPELAAHHAEVRRNPQDDEYLVHAVDGDVSVAGAVVEEGVVLRTGATVTCGEQRFVYVREEFADHGRPYGGREGGEFSRQRPQRRPERYER